MKKFICMAGLIVLLLGCLLVDRSGHQVLPEPENIRCAPLDECMKSIQYLMLGDSPDGLEYQGLHQLDSLLQHGAVPTAQTKELLPFDAALRQRVVEMFEKHGYYILVGEDPYNACCVPE